MDEQIADLLIVGTKKNVARDTVKKAVENWSTFNIEEKKKIAKAYIKRVNVTDNSIDVIFY